MKFISVFVFLSFIFFLSLSLSCYLISFAKNNKLLDIPNNRSSHTLPTPRGGGVSIVLSVIIYVLIVSVVNREMTIISWLGLGILSIAMVAIADDIKGLSASLRMVLYLSIACALVVFINREISLNFQEFLLLLFVVLMLAWVTNLYNFMDGADGLAAVQTLIAMPPAGVILYICGDYEFALLCFVVAAATGGFLVWNWSPAKIFMGDVGSCTLGFLIGGLAYINYLEDTVSIFVWLLLLSFFIVDSTLTLFYRILNKEKWFQAHCNHSYQLYLQSGQSHRKLATGLFLFGILVLWPLTYLSFLLPEFQLLITIIVYTLLSIMWYFIQNKNKASNY